jgi:hypothetical protein
MRLEHSNLRMVFAGSIGLHHVIDALRGEKYASQPMNDMETIEIGPLKQADAADLAERLLTEEEIDCNCREKVVTELVKLADYVPFYIERVVSRLALQESRVTPDIVRQQVRLHLTSDNDHWEMEHFRKRIPIYYPGAIDAGDRNPIAEATVVKAILNVLAVADRAQSINAVCSAIKASIPLENRELVIRLLRELSQDHYLISDDQKRYSFRFPLIKTWWSIAQGLSS